MNAVITGASRGLGKSVALFLAEKGFNLHLIASKMESLNAVKKEVSSQFEVEVHTYACDFSVSSNTAQLGAKLADSLNSIELLINNTGAFEFGSLTQTNTDQLSKLINVNVMGAFNISNALLPMLKTQQKGHVFNIGSIVTEHPRKDIAAYTISKFALKGYTQVLRDELKDAHVKVTEIVPGSINTSSWDGVEDVPKNDFIQPQELVDAIWMCYRNTAASNIESFVIRPLNRDF